ncbi:IPT/TIG domain-containing protein [Streptomyces axinellae]|uniref:IPT/TIG domain-containing protein n=1 Tax=Streptomyces axinellae TaxID=552788 RepID=A0ABP6D8Q8_9ACTN
MAPVINTISPTSGKAGDSLTISGSGLGSLSTTKVNLGSKTVTPNLASNTSVTVTVPSGCSGQANLSVTVSGVNSNTKPFFFLGAPTVTALTPSAGPATGNPAIDVFGSGFATATLVSFGAVGSVAPASIVSDTHLTAVPPNHATPIAGCVDSVNVLVTSPGGQSVATGAPGQFEYYDAPSINTLTPNTGPAGTTGVIVDGDCFVGVTSVTLDDGVNPPTSADNIQPIDVNTVVFAVPPALATGAYSVVVTTPGGPSNAVTFTVTP